MIFEKYFKQPQNATLPSIMIGEVVNNNDPQQMGRLQVHIASHSTERNLSTDLSYYPWVSYGAPFGGIDTGVLKGPGNPDSTYPEYGDRNSGPVAYGMWAIPKVGARVLICAVDNDPNQLYWIGCVYPNSTPHTLPHGRYSTRIGSGTPDGPFDTTETPIAPLYDNLTKAFSGRDNFEWRSRGADYQVAAATIKRVSDEDPRTGTLSKIHDDGIQTITEEDGNNLGKDFSYRQGYAESRVNPDTKWDEDFHTLRDIQTDKLMESSVYSFTSPGFHSLSMDDRPENCRMRLRTTTGHQILLDDTNERIYVSTNEGRNWIEMDSDGHIYVYSEESISMRAEGDINLTSEKSVRIKGKEGVHIQSDKELRIHAIEDIHVLGEKQLYTQLTEDIHLQTAQNLRVKTEQRTLLEAVSTLDIKSTNVNLDSGGNMNLAATMETAGDIKSGGKIESAGDIKSGGDIGTSQMSLNDHTHLYNPGPNPPTPTQKGTSGSVSSASTSTSPDPWGGINAEQAFWTNIVPHHEPWARTFIKQYEENKNHEPELQYDDPSVGKSMKKVKDTDRKRGKLWHR